jgi:DNA-binding beta-propeller fold protein YncE
MGTGPGSNPQDVAMVGHKLYLPIFGGTGILVLDRDNPSWRTTVDLSSLDPDGAPNCASAYAVGTEVYVTCGLLDDKDHFKVRGNGRVAVIDSIRDKVITTFNVGGKNPFGLIERSPVGSVFGGDLLVPLVTFGNYEEGCLARLKVGDELGPNGCAVTNKQLGGYPSHVEASPDGNFLWMSVVDYDFVAMKSIGKLVALDLTTGKLLAPVTSPSRVISDLAVCPNGWVVVSDTTPGASGMRLYSGLSEITAKPLDIGTPPSYSGNNLTCL